MRKAIILTTITSLIFLSGCSLNNNNVQTEKITQLEQQLNDLQTKYNQQQEVINNIQTTAKPAEITNPAEVTNPAQETNKPTTDIKEPVSIQKDVKNEQPSSFINILSPENDAILYEEPFYVTGETSTNCDKIVATAKNEEYKINDVYTLQNYKRGNTTFKYGVKHEWGNLDAGKNLYSFTAYCDSGNKETAVSIYYQFNGGAEMGKPVIYLYPGKEQKTFVLPKPEGGITISEPKLADGWNVTAYPDGKIVDKSGAIYPYLFWEGFSDLTTPKEGFLVKKDDLSSFFDKKLAYLGLNMKEINDFKEYWLNKLNEKNYYFISFISQAELDKHAPIQIEPKPDTAIRVFFDYKASDTPFTFTEQKLEKGADRNGFTMIEWGGRLY